MLNIISDGIYSFGQTIYLVTLKIQKKPQKDSTWNTLIKKTLDDWFKYISKT